MNALTNPKAAQIASELESDIGILVPGLENLLSRVAGAEPLVAEFERTSIRLVAPLTFPDSIGHGEVVATLFHYRDQVRLDVEIEHNRMFARPDGTPSDRACYLNDFVASVTLAQGAQALPDEVGRPAVARTARPPRR